MAKAGAKATNPTLTWARVEASPSIPGKTPLTRDEIVGTAIRLIDEHGLESFSMRRLGAELDAGATSLYWHVRNKEELIDLILDVLIGEVLADFEATVDPGASWRERLADVARALRRVLVRHRHVAPLLGGRPTLGPNALEASERVMGILIDAGFDHRTTSLASGSVMNYAAGFAVFESRSPGGWGEAPEGREVVEAVMAYFASLPADRYPTMRAVAAIPISEDDQFEYGLARLLDGLESDLAHPERRPAAGDEGPGTGNVLLTR
jgi:AcrR family transcriptional regulator